MKTVADKFVVYAAELDGVIIYIGSGKFGRQVHCNSGCSHVWELNRLHFEGKGCDVRVTAVYPTKEEASAEEKRLIIAHKPKLNKIFNPDRSLASVNNGLYKRWSTFFWVNLPRKEYWFFSDLVQDLVEVFGAANLVSCEGVNLRGLRYRNGYLPSNIETFIRCKNRKGGSYLKHKYLYDIVCAKEGFIKFPKVPPPLIKSNSEEGNKQENVLNSVIELAEKDKNEPN